MKKLPSKLKRKLLQMNNTALKLQSLVDECSDIITSEYGLDLDLFMCVDNEKESEYKTMAFNEISNGSFDFDEEILDFERVFLLHINKK